jgi:4-nitrophenyl phosphatase
VPFFATAQGRALGSSRAIAAAITSITGKRAQALGKPAPAALASALRRLDCKARDLVVVGDDPSLEAAMARRAGAMGIAVASGVVGREGFDSLPEAQRPQTGVDELLALLAQG